MSKRDLLKLCDYYGVVDRSGSTQKLMRKLADAGMPQPTSKNKEAWVRSHIKSCLAISEIKDYPSSLPGKDVVIKTRKMRRLHWKESVKRKKKKKLKIIEEWGFYGSPEWRALRLMVFKRWGRECLKCGSKYQIQVDHILPRSKFPLYDTNFNNLQPLCKKCNKHKSNKYFTDYRPVNSVEHMELLTVAQNQGVKIK